MAWPGTALHDEAEDEGSSECTLKKDPEAWGEDAAPSSFSFAVVVFLGKHVPLAHIHVLSLASALIVWGPSPSQDKLCCETELRLASPSLLLGGDGCLKSVSSLPLLTSWLVN